MEVGLKRKPDPYLRVLPWRIYAVFAPLDRILHRLELDGTVDVSGRQIVFREDSRGGWYDTLAALRGVAEFHDLAAGTYGIPVDTSALWKFAAKLDAGSPLFEQDIVDVRTSIASCKRQAMQLRVSQADALIRTVQISAEQDRLKGRAA